MLDISSLYRHINVLRYAYHVRGAGFSVFKNTIIAHLDCECSHWLFECKFFKVVFLKEHIWKHSTLERSLSSLITSKRFSAPSFRTCSNDHTKRHSTPNNSITSHIPTASPYTFLLKSISQQGFRKTSISNHNTSFISVTDLPPTPHAQTQIWATSLLHFSAH